jgi:hypothetical protein
LKKVIFFVLIGLSFASADAQTYPELPNNEFNNWDAGDYNPTDWGTVESAFQQHFGMTIRDTSDKVNGPASLKLVTNTQTGSLTRASASVGYTYYATNPHGIRVVGAKYAAQPDTLWVLYKYATPQSDTAGVQMGLYINPSGNQIFSLQVFYALKPVSQWTLKAFDLKSHYSSNQMPDSIIFNLFSSATTAGITSGSTLQVDGVYFNPPGGNVTGISTAQLSTGDLSIYPNPSSGNNIYLQSSAKLNGYQFELHSISGNEVLRTKIEKADRPEINISGLSSGAYLWLLVDKNGRIVNKGKWMKTN